MPAWFDELRIVKGKAVWTASFTPPSSPYTTSGGDVAAFAGSVVGVVQQGSALLAATASLTAAARQLAVASARLAPAAALAAAGFKLSPGQALLAPSAALTATGFKLSPGTGLLASTGALSSTAVLQAGAAATFGATGSLLADVQLRGVQAGSALLAATGSLAASGTLRAAASPILTLQGALNAQATLRGATASLLAGTGGLAAVAALQLRASASLSPSGGLLADIQLRGIQAGNALLAAAGSLVASTIQRAQAASVLASEGGVMATAFGLSPAAATLAAAGSLIATASGLKPAQAALASAGALSAVTYRLTPATASLVPVGTLTASAFKLSVCDGVAGCDRKVDGRRPAFGRIRCDLLCRWFGQCCRDLCGESDGDAGSGRRPGYDRQSASTGHGELRCLRRPEGRDSHPGDASRVGHPGRCRHITLEREFSDCRRRRSSSLGQPERRHVQTPGADFGDARGCCESCRDGVCRASGVRPILCRRRSSSVCARDCVGDLDHDGHGRSRRHGCAASRGGSSVRCSCGFGSRYLQSVRHHTDAGRRIIGSSHAYRANSGPARSRGQGSSARLFQLSFRSPTKVRRRCRTRCRGPAVDGFGGDARGASLGHVPGVHSAVLLHDI